MATNEWITTEGARSEDEKQRWTARVALRRTLFPSQSAAALRLMSSPNTLVLGLVNMDPPYNVRVEPRSNNAVAASLAAGKSGSSKGDRKSVV